MKKNLSKSSKKLGVEEELEQIKKKLHKFDHLVKVLALETRLILGGSASDPKPHEWQGISTKQTLADITQGITRLGVGSSIAVESLCRFLLQRVEEIERGEKVAT